MSIPKLTMPFSPPRQSRWGDPEPRLFGEPGVRQSTVVAGADAGEFQGVSATVRAGYLTRMNIKAGNRIVLISVQDVVWIQSHGNLLRLYLYDASYEQRMTMKEICQQLNPEYFVRVHRNAMVNLDHVLEFELPRCGNALVRLRNGKILPISGTARVTLRRGLLTWSRSSMNASEL